MKILILFCLLVFFLGPFMIACTSSQKRNEPDWIHANARQVDNGYIVYVASADSETSDRAQFKAEGLALEDLANECSLIPKGTRIEDRFVEETDHYKFEAFVKVGIEFQVCETAKKTIKPEDIKELASLPFSEQLRKYQDLVETGEMPKSSEVADVTPPVAYAQPPPYDGGDNIHFYATRQYIAYQKQIVILSPAPAYAPGTLNNRTFITAISPSVERVQMTETQNPSIAKAPTTWSTMRNRVPVTRPVNLSHAGNYGRPRTLRPTMSPNERRERVRRVKKKTRRDKK